MTRRHGLASGALVAAVLLAPPVLAQLSVIVRGSDTCPSGDAVRAALQAIRPQGDWPAQTIMVDVDDGNEVGAPSGGSGRAAVPSSAAPLPAQPAGSPGDRDGDPTHGHRARLAVTLGEAPGVRELPADPDCSVRAETVALVVAAWAGSLPALPAASPPTTPAAGSPLPSPSPTDSPPSDGEVLAAEQPRPTPGPGEGRVEIAVSFLPMLLGRVVTNLNGPDTSFDLDAGYGLSLALAVRIFAGLSLGLAPQVVFHLSAKDAAGYTVIDSEREYDLMARIAYAYGVIPRLKVYAELLPGYSLVTYHMIVLGAQAPNARGTVFGGGLGAAYAIDDRFFAKVGIGYQVGSQISHGIRDVDLETSFLRLDLGGGVRF